MKSVAEDPLIHGFTCHFTAIWDAKPGDAGACSNSEVAFAPSSKPIALIKEEIGRAQKTIDVLMHHFVFDDLVTELAKAADVVLPGAAALGLIIYNYVNLQSRMDAAQKGKIEEFGDEPLREFVEAYAAEFSYGWIVMGAGALVLILAPFVKLRAPPSSAG